MKTIGIIGSRRRNSDDDLKITEQILLSILEEDDWIVSGACKEGGDHFADILYKKYQVNFKCYPAKWKKHGKIAGFLRNTNIAEDSDILIAVVAEDRTGGTEDTIKKFCKKYNKTEQELIKEKKLYLVSIPDEDSWMNI
jgi:hypothetical protein